jgi:hypothetical protein
MRTFLQLLIIAALATPAFAQNKKVVFLADRGKNSKTHAHESGNELLANALEKSELGFETSLHKGWPADPKAFDRADCVVIFCNGGKGASRNESPRPVREAH